MLPKLAVISWPNLYWVHRKPETLVPGGHPIDHGPQEKPQAYTTFAAPAWRSSLGRGPHAAIEAAR
jgi:hypothetical protein